MNISRLEITRKIKMHHYFLINKVLIKVIKIEGKIRHHYKSKLNRINDILGMLLGSSVLVWHV